MALILASKSPRRRQLMGMLTHDFAVKVAGVNEQAVEASTPSQLAARLAQAKAAAVQRQNPADTVIGCDTVVELGGKPFGKPADEAEAVAMLTALSGQIHQVHTGVCVFRAEEAVPAALFIETTEVEFAPLTAAEILAYVQTGAPFDKAGGYGIQGDAAKFIPRISGCYYNVMGLPVAALHRVLAGLGIDTSP